MINPSLTMRYADLPVREAAAAVIPGNEAEGWFETMQQAGVSLADSKFLLIPESGSLRCLAALVITSSAALEHLPAECIRYGRLGSRLFAPVHATFRPVLEDDEWDRLLPDDDSQFVWHPLGGLIQFEPREQLCWKDLVSLPEVVDADWSHVDPGVNYTDRLEQIVVPMPAIEVVLADAKGDIGSQADPSTLPRHPGESRWKTIAVAPLLPLTLAAAWIQRKMQEAALKALSRPSGRQSSSAGTGSVPGFGVLSRLASAVGRGLSKSLQKAVAPVQVMTERVFNERIKALQRLLHQFDQNPDEALRYALPLGGDPGRGGGGSFAGWQLPARVVDFFLGGMGRGGGAPWAAPPDVFHALTARYREAAQRELRLGRYRRAAYIYSNLLNEHQSAAAALVQGKFYLEAAALYRDKLKDRRRAAECLEQGGLLQQAIEIYEELEHFQQAAMLYERLGDEERAEAAYRRAVDEQLKKGNVRLAAELLETRLKAPDEAIDLLENRWHEPRHSSDRFRQMFEICDRAARHSRASSIVKSIDPQILSGHQTAALLEVLPVQASGYSDRAVQKECVAQAQRIISQVLVQNGTLRTSALEALGRLAPDDRILERDCNLFQSRSTRPTRVLTRPLRPQERSGSVATLQSQFLLLPHPAKWRAATTSLNSLFVAGFHAGTLRVLQVAWGDETSQTAVVRRQEFMHPVKCCPLILTIHDNEISLAAQVSESIEPQQLRAVEPTPPAIVGSRTCTVATPRWFQCHSDILAAADRSGHWILNSAGLLRHCDEAGLERKSIRLPLKAQIHLDVNNVPTFAHLCMTSMGPLVAVNEQVFLLTSKGTLLEHTLPARVTGVAPSALGTAIRVAVFHEQGGTMLWPASDGFSMTCLPDDLVDAQGVFLLNGRLAVWSGSRSDAGVFRFFRVTSRDVTDLGGCANKESVPWRMLRTGNPAQWGLITEEGRVEIWQLEEA
jgi:tetratricopeptide (TPR) repeat protein